MKKITLATVKSFVKKNRENLYINLHSRFDGMHDCIMPAKGGFEKAQPSKQGVFVNTTDHTLGIEGAWFVYGSRDYLKPFENETMKGFEISNCCGNFTLAIQK